MIFFIAGFLGGVSAAGIFGWVQKNGKPRSLRRGNLFRTTAKREAAQFENMLNYSGDGRGQRAV